MARRRRQGGRRRCQKVAACAVCRDFMRLVRDVNKGNAWKYHKLATDPPDPNFTALPTVVVPAVPAVTAGEGISPAAATAATEHLRLLAQTYAQAQAALTAIERAQGARLAGDATWEQRQSLAAADLLKGLSTRLSGLPAARAHLGDSAPQWRLPQPHHHRRRPRPGHLRPTGRRSGRGRLVAPAGRPHGGPGARGGGTARRARGRDQRTAPPARRVRRPRSGVGGLRRGDLAQRRRGGAARQPPGGPRRAAGPAGHLAAAHHRTDGGSHHAVHPGPVATEGTSVLANSGFEAPLLTNGAAYQTITAGRTPGLDGWTIQKGSVDVVAPPGAQAATGGQFIDLNGNDTSDGPGVITQEAAVTPGRAYRLSFQLAGNPNGDPPDKTVQVELGPQQQTFTFNIKGHTNADLGWRRRHGVRRVR